MPKFAALILAAGYSARMPQFKPLLPLARTTVLEQAVGIFAQAGISDITVVAGHQAGAVTAVLDRLQVKYIINRNFAAGMFSSVQTGVQALAPGIDAFFLLPVDIPLVRSHTIKTLGKFFKRKQAGIIYPVFQGQRGHPPLINRRLIPEIAAWNRPEGLRSLLERHEADACDAAVIDSGILQDMDTAGAYREILARYRYRHLPDERECAAILARFRVAEPVVRHGRLVAEVAGKLARRLNQCGAKLDVNLAMAGGLLHDVAKGKPFHARRGARLLAGAGYLNVAAVVACHTDISINPESNLDEAAIVYLADKLVKGDCLVSIEERFRDSLIRHTAAEARIAAQQRFLQAKEIAAKIEQATGAALQAIIAADNQACREKTNRKPPAASR